MIKQILKKQVILLNLILFIMSNYGLAVGDVLTMDLELRNLPQPKGSKIVWQDKAVEVNNIKVISSRLSSSLSKDEIINFYKDILSQKGWKLTGEYNLQDILSFEKGDYFFYLGVIPNGKINDIYLVLSPRDLRLCRVLVDYFFKEEMAPDAEGKDLSDIPKYPASKRRLNIFTEREGAFVLYETDASVEEVSGFYRSLLPQLGWKLIPVLNPKFLSRFSEARVWLDKVAILYFERGNETLFITAYPTPRGAYKARTLISITKNLMEEIYPEEKEE